MKERAREEEAAAKNAQGGADMRHLDDEIAPLRRMNLRPTTLAAALAEIERQRAELLARAGESRDSRENRASRHIARLPTIVTEYRRQIAQAVKVLSKPDVVAQAAEATRRLLVDGRILLTPNAARDSVAGAVHFKELGNYALELAGVRRQCSFTAEKLVGSGGRI